MKQLIALALILYASSALSETLCFSPVKERDGDVSSDRSFWQPFEYRVQVDDGPIVKPSEEVSTSYSFTSEKPLIKIYLGEKLVESFPVRQEWLSEGRNCIYFKNIYEALQTGNQPIVTGEQANLVIRVIEAALESNESGKRIYLD